MMVGSDVEIPEAERRESSEQSHVLMQAGISAPRQPWRSERWTAFRWKSAPGRFVASGGVEGNVNRAGR
jgi:hypothetical protein